MKINKAKRIHTGSRSIFSCEIPKEYALAYEDIIKKSPDYICIELSAPKKKRTTGEHSQSHHLNGHVQQIAAHTGNTFEDVKLYAKRQAFSRGLPFLLRDDGSVVYSLSDGQPLPMSERDMNTIQCGWVIDELHILAGELGIVLMEE